MRKLLIANRGDCCLRIARTAKRLGMATVALAEGRSGPDDVGWGAVDQWITPSAAVDAQSYLDVGGWIRWAQQYGADAIHPGWGFLAERSDFARSVAEAGLIWVGPPAEVMAQLACKHTARLLAHSQGIPTAACSSTLYHLPQHEALLQQEAQHIEFPALLKYSSGGGGRGMAVVHEASQLLTAARRCYEQGRKHFGSGGLIIERYLESSRHIEVQVLADEHSQVVALGQREGTVQRRYQKIIEEAPPPFLSQDILSTLEEHSRTLVTNSGYRGVGTVEFLVVSPAGENATPQVFFLEMNTRLQVEHALTEELYGLDLVEWQLRIAAGQPLSAAVKSLEQLRPQRCSIEVRLCAEDACKDFIPTTGILEAVHLSPALPPPLCQVRYERGGLYAGCVVSDHFDSLLAKIIVTAPSREQALEVMDGVLEDLLVVGLITNGDFLHSIIRSPQFKQRGVCSTFLAEHLRQWLPYYNNAQDELAHRVAPLLSHPQRLSQELSVRGHFEQSSSPSQLKAREIFTSSQGPSSLQQFVADLGECTVELLRRSAATKSLMMRCAHGGSETADFLLQVALKASGEQGFIALKCGDVSWQKSFASAAVPHSSQRRSNDKEEAKKYGVEAVRAPTSGAISAVRCVQGQKVAEGEELFVLESMKMEIPVLSPRRGTVAQVCIAAVQHVARGDVLMVYAEEKKADSD